MNVTCKEECMFWDGQNCHFETVIQGLTPCHSCPEVHECDVVSAYPVFLDSEDCSAGHCPPSMYEQCQWPKCRLTLNREQIWEHDAEPD